MRFFSRRAPLALLMLGVPSLVMAQPAEPVEDSGGEHPGAVSPGQPEDPAPPVAAEEPVPVAPVSTPAPAPPEPAAPAPDTAPEASATEPEAPTPAAPEPVSDSSDSAPAPPATPKKVEAPLIRTDNGRTASAEQARGWDEEPGVDDADVALALPRVILFLPKLTIQLVMLPIQGVMWLVDAANIVEHVENILYFDEAHDFGWYPSVEILTDFGGSLGATLFHKSLFGNDELLEVNALFGGRYAQFYELHLEANGLGGSRMWLESRARYESDRGEMFGGIGIAEQTVAGPDADPRQSNERTFLGQERGFGLLRMGYVAGHMGSYAKAGGTAILNHRVFSDNRRDEVQTTDVYDTSLLPGFDDGVTSVEVQANVVLDYRASAGLDSRGGYLEMFGGYVPGLSPFEYWHYGAEASYTIDLYRRTRLLTLRTALEAVEGEDAEIPFSELPRLGGPDRLRGYIEGRYRAKRSAFASVVYQYPIHKNVLGELFFDAGYVSDDYASLYNLTKWKVGYGGGFLVGSSDSLFMKLELAMGEQFQFLLSTDLARAFDGRSTQL